MMTPGPKMQAEVAYPRTFMPYTPSWRGAGALLKTGWLIPRLDFLLHYFYSSLHRPAYLPGNDNLPRTDWSKNFSSHRGYECNSFFSRSFTLAFRSRPVQCAMTDQGLNTETSQSSRETSHSHVPDHSAQ